MVRGGDASRYWFAQMVVRGAAELARSVVTRVNDEEDGVRGGAVAWCRFRRRVRVVAADAEARSRVVDGGGTGAAMAAA